MSPISHFKLPTERLGDRGPLFVALHWLGASGKAWRDVASILASRGAQCVAIDLPGFGEANGIAGFDVRAMSEAVIEVVQTLRQGTTGEPWVIAGHSMGGKVASVVARAAVDGREGLQNLRGVFLVSPSPPSPEPMDESKRQQMLKELGESSGTEEEDRKRAKVFVEDNTGKLPLPAKAFELSIEVMLRMNRTAFRAWLQSGSKEDWSAAVGKLPLPARILAGSEESALGPNVQRKDTAPHYASAEVIELHGCGHLAPLERPFEVAEYASSFFTSLGIELEAIGSRLGQAYATLLESSRVSAQTRAVMETRLSDAATWNHEPSALSGAAFRTMRALAECVVPHAGIDIAAGVEERLARGSGDGWRFATLPPGAEAWRRGLASLDVAAKRQHSVSFVALHRDLQDALLQKAQAGELGKGLLGAMHVGEAADAFSAAEMKQWFEDVRGEFAKCYMAHPATMERVGFTGFADERGFTQIQIGQREEFER